MGQVTGMTATEIEQELSSVVVSGSIDPNNGHLLLRTKAGAVMDGGAAPVPPPPTIPKPYESWPVGSIFMSTVATSPATLLGGGTWVRWGKGRVPVSLDEAQTEFDGVEEVGGEKTHTLTTAETPAHAHTINHDHGAATTSVNGSHNHTPADMRSAGGQGTQNRAMAGAGTSALITPFGTDSQGDHSHTFNPPAFAGNSGSAGGGGAHNNLQPYITCYMWKRTA